MHPAAAEYGCVIDPHGNSRAPVVTSDAGSKAISDFGARVRKTRIGLGYPPEEHTKAETSDATVKSATAWVILTHCCATTVFTTCLPPCADGRG